MEDGIWSLYDMPAGERYPGKSVHDVLAEAFWQTFCAGMGLVLMTHTHCKALGIATRLGVIRRYFLEEMLDEIDLEKKGQRTSMEYARGILLHLRHDDL